MAGNVTLPAVKLAVNRPSLGVPLIPSDVPAVCRRGVTRSQDAELWSRFRRHEEAVQAAVFVGLFGGPLS